MKRICLTVFALVLTALAFVSPAYTQTVVVVPNDLENSPGNVGIIVPFDCAAEFTEVRYQQVYLGSQFPQEGLIDRVSFRLVNPNDGGNPGFGPTLVPNILLEMSTTQAQPNTLSTTFANNVGPDVQAVYSGDITVSAPACNIQPCPFDMVIPLQNPFYYDPVEGNLLLDFRLPECVVAESSDATTSLLGITNAVGTTNNNVDSPTGINIDIAAVTQFRILDADQVITLSPATAVNEVLTDHTVTASVNSIGVPQEGILVSFEVISGPNQGETSDPDSGECAPNDDCTTDENGEVSWTYSSQQIGTDTIVASFEGFETTIESNPVEKIWVLIRNVPTLSEWSLIAMALVLGISGFIAIRRRKAAAY